MKKSIILFFSVVLFVLSSSHYSQPEQSNIVGFGVIKYNNHKISGVSVKVFHNNRLIENIITGRKVGYGFSLQFNTDYIIEIVKEGFLKQTILMDTRVSEEVLAYNDRILWEPDFIIYKIMPGLEWEEFHKPIANYVFDEELWGFYEDKNYQTSVASEFNEVITQLDSLKKEAYTSELSRADSLYNQQNFEEAIIAYTEAGKYNSEEKYNSSQIKGAKKLLKKQYSTDEGYTKALEKADGFFIVPDFDLATNYYQKALIYKPDELYALDKLYEIDSIRSYAWVNKVAEFDNHVSTADSLFNSNEFVLSEHSYVSALTIFPKKDYPQQMLAKIDSINKIEAEHQNKLAEALALKADSIIAATKTKEETQPDAERERKKRILINKSEKNISKPQEIIPNKKEIKSQMDESPNTLEVEEEVSQDENETISNQELVENIITEELDPRQNLMKLQEALKANIESGNKANSSVLLDEMGQIHQSENDLKKALQSYSQSLEIKREVGDTLGEIKVLNSIASVMYDSGQYYSAIQQFEESLELSDEINDEAQSSEILDNIAAVFENTFRFDEAIEKLEQSKEIKEKLGDKVGTSQIYKNIGNIYYEQNNFTQAVEELKKAVAIEADLENKDELGSSLNNLGAAYYSMKKYDKAEEYYEQALENSQENENLKDQSLTLNNIGNINFDLGNYTKAIDYYEQSLQLKTQLSFQEGMASSLHNLGNSYFAMEDYTKALEYFKSSQELAEKVSYHEIIWRNYEAFGRTYAALGNYKMAFENQQKYTRLKFESLRENNQLVELREEYESSRITVKNLRRELQKQSRIAKYEAERNRQEIEIIEKDIAINKQKLKRQRAIILSFVIVSLLILVFSLLMTKQYRQIKKAYQIVAEQKRNITEGISYAARIQKAVSPPELYVQSILPEHFILNHPCEVVGGDFYWVTKHFSKILVAVSDCTGHGVPGGFMSMLGVSLLNEILSSEKPLETHEILTQLRDRVVSALHQKGGDSESLDGMDITLIMIDPKTNIVQFSAAYHSLYVIRNNEFEKFKGDRIPIGFHFKHKPFTSQNIQLEKGNMIYMTSDGYTDQIGGPNQTRFMIGSFREQLLSVWQEPMDQQKELLIKNIEAWKGNLPQTDDVLVMGIRI